MPMREMDAVQRLVKKYNSSNPFILCECLGYNVRFADIGEYRGMYRYSKRNHFITINSNLDEYLHKAVCAHELAHAQLHKGINRVFMDTTFFRSQRYEREADRFAAYLLLSEYDEIELNRMDINQISKLTGIPVEYLKLIK